MHSTTIPTEIPELRLRALNDAPYRREGSYVLYWMVAARRVDWSYAIDRGLELAGALGLPLLIFEPVNVDYPWASDRHHAAILDGMAEHRARLERGPIGYFPYVEPEPGAGAGLLATLAGRAGAVVTDDAPTFFTPSLLEAAGRIQACRVEAVDGCGLLPLRATDRTFSSAHHFRRFLQRALPEELAHRPSAEPFRDTDVPRFEGLPREVERRWPMASERLLGTVSGGRPSPALGLGALAIDHTVTPTGWRGGATAARSRLRVFLQEGLDRYADERNDPDSDVASRLSPWLHYGQLSTHEIFHAVVASEGWSPARIAPPHDGRRRGWWGMNPGAEAFLDQLVTWRELGFGYCARQPDYARYDTLPAWAIETLDEHANDARGYVYSLDQFAMAETHDELWNAAQRQLREEGIIHNYLRMLWGKKILEWTSHPRQALDIMIELNNRYALDGRDPNSYSGIMWILGRFDRGWPERDIYGKVRSMTSDSTRRKVELTRYLERWGEEGARP